jgi:hypothetical protein
VDAYAHHETRLADFYRKRFRGEFRPAVATQAATRPLRGAKLTTMMVQSTLLLVIAILVIARAINVLPG